MLLRHEIGMKVVMVELDE